MYMSIRALDRRIVDLSALSGIPIRKKNPQKETRSAETECTQMYMSIRVPDQRIVDLLADGYTKVFSCFMDFASVQLPLRQT
jgi:hypothetical protein